MAILQKMHRFAGRIDPVVKWADKQNLTPSSLYTPEALAPDIVRPVTEAGKARAKNPGGPTITPTRRKASDYLAKPRGLLGGG